MNKIKIVALATVCIFSLGACRTKKLSVVPEQKMQVKISEEEILKKNAIASLATSDFNYNFLSSKAKVKINREGKDFSLTFNIRMQKDEQIWISVNAIGGIEVARALLNKDSVRLLDRLNKQYIVKDYLYLSELLNTKVDFFLLQDLMLGNNPKNLEYINASFSQSENLYIFEGLKDFLNYTINTRKEDSKLVYIQLKDSRDTKKNVNVNYGGFKLVENTNFPFLISSVASSEKESLSLNLEYVKVEKVEKLEFPFNVPKKFD